MPASRIDSPSTRRAKSSPPPKRSGSRLSASSGLSTARRGWPAAISPSRGIRARGSGRGARRSRTGAPPRRAMPRARWRRRSICPLRSRARRWSRTDPVELRPNRSPISRIVGGRPQRAISARMNSSTAFCFFVRPLAIAALSQHRKRVNHHTHRIPHICVVSSEIRTVPPLSFEPAPCTRQLLRPQRIAMRPLADGVMDE